MVIELNMHNLHAHYLGATVPIVLGINMGFRLLLLSDLFKTAILDPSVF